MNQVLIKNGEYRNAPVVNQKFVLVKGFQTGKKGNYVTVRNDGQFNIDIENVRIKIAGLQDIEFSGSPVFADPDTENELTTIASEPEVTETDEETMDRIAQRFEILDLMAGAAIAGDIRALIVSGPPGIGKSFGVMKQLDEEGLSEDDYNIVKGQVTPLGLYTQLYNHRLPGQVLVLDDCDSVYFDDLSLNLLKSALDTSKVRRLSWHSTSRYFEEEGIPQQFEFEGSVIFLTNLKFENVKSKKLQDHLQALESRVHFCDLTIDTDREKVLRLKQIHRDSPGGLFSDYDFSSEVGQEVIDWVATNKDRLREMSVRTCLKVADLVKMAPHRWQELAEVTVLKRR